MSRHAAFLAVLVAHIALVFALLSGSSYGLRVGSQRAVRAGEGGAIEVSLEDLSEPARRVEAPAPPVAQTNSYRPARKLRTARRATEDTSIQATSLTESASSAPAAEATVSDYGRLLLAYIERNKHYPEMPGAQKPRGTVRILFTLARSGSVLGVWIQTSSGYVVLDRAAVETLLQGQPLPAIPPGLPDVMNFSFDIDFSPLSG